MSISNEGTRTRQPRSPSNTRRNTVHCQQEFAVAPSIIEERRRCTVLPHAFGERPVPKLKGQPSWLDREPVVTKPFVAEQECFILPRQLTRSRGMLYRKRQNEQAY